MSKTKRRLAAIMFTDIVGYSAMMQKDEEIGRKLRARHRQVFDRLTGAYEGKILQYFGDGTLSIFPSSAAAVECAIAIQRELKKPPHVPLRIGIHSGDITYSEEEAYGDGVNVSSRIEALCVPGGVFISGKVYDDIKNQKDLQARQIGQFELKNIRPKVEVYAVTNHGLTVPDYTLEESQAEPPSPSLTQVDDRKSKWVAGILAFFFGIFGVHRFYLGQQRLGVVYFAMFLAGIFIWNKLVPALAILAFVDAMLFFFQSKKSFNNRYNQPQMIPAPATAKPSEESGIKRQKQFLQGLFEKYLAQGKAAYAEYNYEEAIHELNKAVEIRYDDPEAHFLLACCYSINENAEEAFTHLDAAVAFGLDRPAERIRTHDDLSFLRIQAGFDAFADNGFRLPAEALPPDTLELKDPDDLPLLKDLSQLEELRERGILTEEEYRVQRARINQEED